jgi:hypothetical protein
MSESDYSENEVVVDAVDQEEFEQEDPQDVDVDDSSESSEPQQGKSEKSSYIDFKQIPESVREKIRGRIDADYRKIQTLKKEESDARRKIREYEEKMAELSKPREVAPPTPDDWYSDPEGAAAKMNAFAESKAKHSEWTMQQQQRQLAAQAEFERERQARFEDFGKRAEKAGVKPERLATAAMILDKALPADHQNYLLEHEFGPQLINALASDPVELADLANLSPYQVGVKLDKVAAAFRRKTKSSAPPPDEPIKGSGVSAKDPYGGMLGNFS